jgi:hypothetical protein
VHTAPKKPDCLAAEAAGGSGDPGAALLRTADAAKPAAGHVPHVVGARQSGVYTRRAGAPAVAAAVRSCERTGLAGESAFPTRAQTRANQRGTDAFVCQPGDPSDCFTASDAWFGVAMRQPQPRPGVPSGPGAVGTVVSGGCLTPCRHGKNTIDTIESHRPQVGREGVGGAGGIVDDFERRHHVTACSHRHERHRHGPRAWVS